MFVVQPIAETDFTKIEKPRYEDRIALFSNLAYNNWTMEEMSNGTAWKMIDSYHTEVLDGR